MKSLTLLSLFITLAAFAVSGNAVAPLISTLAAQMGLKPSSFGVVITLQFLAFSLASFVGGALKERLRLSNMHLVRAGLAIICAAFFAGALVLHSAAALIAWVIPLGIAGGAVETFSSLQISRMSRADSSKNLCLSQGFYTIGAFAAPQVVYLIFGAGLEWQTAFVVFGLFAAAVLAFFVLTSLRARKLDRVQAVPFRETRRLFGHSSTFSLLVLLMLSTVLLESLSASWLSYIFELRHGLNARNASLALVLFWLGMMTGRFLIVLLPARLTMWPALLTCAAAILAAAGCLAAVHTLSGGFVFVALMGVFLGPMWPVIVMTSSTTFASERLTSALIGIGALGFASGPLIGSFLLRWNLAGGYFLVDAGMGALIVVSCVGAWRAHARAAVDITQGG